MANLYDDWTAEALFDRMLDRYQYEFDKREGSLVWDEFRNVAIELRHLYIQLDWQWKQMFGDTAGRESLIRLAADRDIYPMPASPAVVLGEFNSPVQSGERFNAGDLNFTLKEAAEGPDPTKYYYNLMCEIPGTDGNMADWELRPIRTVPGLQRARIIGIQVPGEDEEPTEDFRERYYETLRHSKYGFNIAEYQYQVKLIPGVGAVRTYPADPSPGRVRVVVLDGNNMPATSTLIERVQEVLDPVPFAQQGIGRAPIGHLVTVETAAEAAVNVSFSLTLTAGTSYAGIAEGVRAAIEGYLKQLRAGWEKAYDPITRTQTGMTVREAQIETRLLDIPGVIDVTNTKINGVAGNFNPPLDAVPILGSVTNV